MPVETKGQATLNPDQGRALMALLQRKAGVESRMAADRRELEAIEIGLAAATMAYVGRPEPNVTVNQNGDLVTLTWPLKPDPQNPPQKET